MIPKQCPRCGETKPTKAFSMDRSTIDGLYSQCKECQARYYERAGKSRELQRKYGITIEEYESMLSDQGGTCAICHKGCVSAKKLAVDHCHDTGKVRGLLCLKCNRGLGSFNDSPALVERALLYLKGKSCLK